jgi:hypothetical protein
MRYKTIIPELLQEEYPVLHERLRASRTLLTSLNTYAHTLRRRHQAWMYQLRRERPDREAGQIPYEALELAIQDLRREALPSESPPSDREGEGLSLDAAMAFLLRPTPSA